MTPLPAADPGRPIVVGPLARTHRASGPRRWSVVGPLVTCLATALPTAACGNSQPAQPSWGAGVEPSVTPAAKPTATPGTLTPAQARTRYLAIVAPYNRALERFESAAQAGRAWTTLRPLAEEVAEANAVHARQLRAVAWPAGVRQPMAALLKQADAAQGDWERAARAKTAEELASAVQAAVRHSGAKEADEVRAELGLPAYTES